MAERTYLEPIGLVDPSVTGLAGEPFLGGPRRFIACRRFVRGDDGNIAEGVFPVSEIHAFAESDRVVRILLDRLVASRPAFAGVAIDRPVLMGVVNVTRDSFSDGGDNFDSGRAIDTGLAMVEAGAGIIDVGGESTRPGAVEIDPAEEIRRTEPVVAALAKAGATVSIDTRHAPVMAAALSAGARIVNDVSALTHDDDSLALVAESDAGVILMHMLGTPATMQKNPNYHFAPLDVYDTLADRLETCRAAGIPDTRLAVDPGIGFGKSMRHNLEILRHIGVFHGLGYPVALGVSRKLKVGSRTSKTPAKARGPGTLAAVLAAADQGVQILRVHDVAETIQALEIQDAIAARP